MNGCEILQRFAKIIRAGADVSPRIHSAHHRALPSSQTRALEFTRRAGYCPRCDCEYPSDKPRFVAGSLSTLEDCYRPDLVPPDDELRAEHSERIHHLVECGVDLILIETINTIREAVIMAKLATITDTPVVVSFVCDRGGKILSGETFTDAARQLLPLISVIECFNTQSPNLRIQAVCGKDFPLIAYGNIIYLMKIGWVNTDSENPEAY